MEKLKLHVFEPNETFYQDHVTFSSVPEIQYLTRALRRVGLTYFTFDRSYKDGSHIRLTNAGAWIESYYRDKLYDVAIFERDPKLFTDGYVFWSWLNREPVYSKAAMHDIDHGLTIIQPHELYCDFFHFGSKTSHYISPQVLVNHLPFLYRFIAYFKERARVLITRAENTRFILPITSLSHIHLADLKQYTEDNDVFQHTQLTRLYLGDEFNNDYLTKREIEILALLKNGMKPVRIADQLGLSERTLETHIKNIKHKLKCSTLFELGFVTNKLGIQNLFPFAIAEEENHGALA